MISEYRGEIVPEYRQSPTMSRAAGVVTVRFVVALVSSLSVLAITHLFVDSRFFPPSNDLAGTMSGLVCVSVAMSAWSVATLFVVACLQNWLGKTHLRTRLTWSIIAGACYPIFSLLGLSFAASWDYGSVVSIALTFIYPIVWGYIAFKSPEMPADWRGSE